MADGEKTAHSAITAQTVSSIAQIGRSDWDALANPEGRAYNPFIAYDFLHALEASKSVTPHTGWTPMHLVTKAGGAINGLMPLYAKGHSQGEYIFDHHWADAYARAGGNYYPKLLCAAPFTPAMGPRLLANDDAAKAGLAEALRQVSNRMGASSAHVNFTSQAEQKILTSAGFLPRTSEQFHWINRDYNRFDDFLAVLSSRKRKAIRRERREATAHGAVIYRLVGDDIKERHWDAFWGFYQDTGARKWGHPYLTRSFFRLIAQNMGERILLIIAEQEGEPIAGALNFIGGDTLYGRYWGCTEDVPFLHFELCYHQAIDFAIENGLARVEAGAQGEHKIARGYEPVLIRSAHWIGDPGFRDAIERYLDAEREQANAQIELLKNYTPFKKS